MKRIHTIYVSIILILSFFIILINLFSFDQIENTLPVSTSIETEKIAYLTFDDGPSENTTKILDILDKYEIRATFFVVGPSYKLKNDLLKEIVNHGHSIAIHSYSHEYSNIYKNTQSYLQDFYECLDWIKLNTGTTPLLYRFPGGSSTTITSKSTIQDIITNLYNKGYKHVDWNVDSFDSHYNNDSLSIINNTLNCIKINETNNIYYQTILMHDNTKKIATLDSLPIIIEKLLSKGYQFKSLTNNSNLIQHIKRPT